MQIKISLIIPIHNRINITKTGLESLFVALDHYNGKDKLKVDIVVVDDGSTDGSSEYITENYPDIHLLKGDGNLWWSGAINLGINYAIQKINSTYVVFWNDDVKVDTNYFLVLDKILKDPNYSNSIISSKVYFQNVPDKIFYFGAYFNFRTGKRKINGSGQIDVGQFNDIIEVDWTGGMGVTVPVSVINAIGLIDDTNFPQYYGDADFTLRAKKNGIKIICHPKLKLWNDRETTGLSHQNSFIQYFKSLFSVRSGNNIQIDTRFYLKHIPLIYVFPAVVMKQSKYFMKLVLGKFKIIAIYLLQLRLYFYNTFLNKLPSKHLRLWISRLFFKVGKSSSIRSNVKILKLRKRQQITIGSNCIINPGCLLDGRNGKLTIGNNVSISRDVFIYNLEHNVDSDYFLTEPGDVDIEDFVWIGSKVVILPGVRIGRGSVIASGAVVTKDIPPMVVAGGIPAKVLKTRNSRLLYKLKDKQFFQ